jgi:2-polyprenyl-3-methyl-5-hydroxy-6-metoxy-1,4-benzoquinol methylase
MNCDYPIDGAVSTPIFPTATKQPLGTEAPERIDIERRDVFPVEMVERHINRYRWAADAIQRRFVRAGRVIDYACGTGYGSAILAKVSNEVLGRDRDEDAVRVANERHSSTLVSFKVRDRIGVHLCTECRKILTSATGAKGLVSVGKCPCADPTFDAVVSIETIEHLDPKSGFGPAEFLRACHDLIIPHGLLVLSTPHVRADGVVDNPWHLREYDTAGLVAEVAAAGFTDIKTDPWLPGFIHLTAVRPA